MKRDGSMGLLTRLYGKRWEGEENLHLILHQHYQIAANKHRALECETNDSAPARLPLYETSISWKKNKTSKLQFYQPRQSEQFTVKLKITITVKPKMKSALSLSRAQPQSDNVPRPLQIRTMMNRPLSSQSSVDQRDLSWFIPHSRC